MIMRNFQLSTVFLEKGKSVFTLLFLFFLSALQAQHIVRGTVTDQDNGSPLIGVSVFEESTPSNGTVTDIDGKFSLKVSSDQATIVASYVGFERERVPLEGRAELAIAMYASITLDEVVVTALGIQREKKALGYATQSLSGDELSAVRSTNLINSLSGKLAGVQVVGASNGIASSSRVVIRGENSLNINNNSPLFVVDGIPVNNNIYGVGSSSIDQADMPTDYGNGAAEINPEDIESVNVLKGAAASALYGARAANGVIVITTKSGKEQQGLGVSFSSSTLFSNPLRLPDVQNQYGGGWGLEYYSDFGTNFGPKLDAGLNVLQDGSPGYDSNTEEPFEYRYKLEDYFQTGLATNNQVSISGGNEKATFRLSYTNSYNEGIVPNTNLKRNYFNLNTAFHPVKNWSINLGANYIKSNSDNLPVAGYGGQGRYKGKGNINRFTPTEQLSLLGMANNVNEPGFSMDDYIDFVLGRNQPKKEAKPAAGKPSAGNSAKARARQRFLKSELASTEKTMTKLRASLSDLDRAMYEPASAPPHLVNAKMSDLLAKRSQVSDQLEEAEAEWLSIGEQLEELDLT